MPPLLFCSSICWKTSRCLTRKASSPTSGTSPFELELSQPPKIAHIACTLFSRNPVVTFWLHMPLSMYMSSNSLRTESGLLARCRNSPLAAAGMWSSTRPSSFLRLSIQWKALSTVQSRLPRLSTEISLNRSSFRASIRMLVSTSISGWRKRLLRVFLSFTGIASLWLPKRAFCELFRVFLCLASRLSDPIAFSSIMSP